MIGDTLTKENLWEIYDAMNRIKAIDRSEYFNNYFQEVKDRLEEDHRVRFINCQICATEYDGNSGFNYSGTCANCVD